MKYIARFLTALLISTSAMATTRQECRDECQDSYDRVELAIELYQWSVDHGTLMQVSALAKLSLLQCKKACASVPRAQSLQQTGGDK